MILWLDAQLSPYLSRWISETFGIEVNHVRELGLRDAKDREIFLAAREAGTVVFTKDSDFVFLLEQLGPPPQIIWLTTGNTSNAYLKLVMVDSFASAWQLIQRGEALVEITDPDDAVS